MFVKENMNRPCMHYFKHFSILAAFTVLAICSMAQPNTEIDLDKDKPKEYENRKLASEKTSEKKFGFPRHAYQNMVSHYNYFFNANNKINEVIEKAKLSFKDDYGKMLPFYNYTLDGTAQQKGDLDSIIYKCTAGILLHDLRSDWVDNLYILLGRAYQLRKNFDSAANCFQYINYIYAPKDDGYDIPIGSNASNTQGMFTVSTNEKRNLWKKITTHNPSRNESFIWQIRNYLEQNQLAEAAGLVSILRTDPLFPKRLHTDLEEMIAFLFYKQQQYDSSAAHLLLAMDNAATKQEQARWEYLAAQMYEASNKTENAINMYERSIKHASDPLLDVYARLHIVTLSSASKKDALQNNLDELLKLAKKDRYDTYRDIIYYAAASLELKRNNYDAAQNLLFKSIQNSAANPRQRSLSFVLLGDLNYTRKHYIDSYRFYDSAKIETLKNIDATDSIRIHTRKPALQIIAKNLIIINREDSLQRIAGIAEPERSAYIKKLLKRLLKEKGIKESDEDQGSYNNITNASQAPSLFGEEKGDWYFLNPTLKAKGFSEFRARWGRRSNVDNWSRSSAVDKMQGKLKADAVSDVDDAPIKIEKGERKVATDVKENEEEEDLSFEGMMSRLPLTQEQVDASNKAIAKALFSNGETFQNKLEDYPPAIESYDELLRRFNNTDKKEDALFNLIYCNHQVGSQAKEDSARKALLEAFPDGQLAAKINGVTPVANEKKQEATTAYENIYKLFIEGSFDKAIEAKRQADAKYGNSYWTPQLLFIESVYYIKQRQDSIAINRLTNLVNLFKTSPMAQKAATMIDVLKRRREIEDYLTSLDVQHNEDGTTRPVDLNAPVVVAKPVEPRKDTVIAASPITSVPVPTIKMDTAAKVITSADKKFAFNPADSQYVMIMLDKVDPLFVGEVRNAFGSYNRQKFYNQKIDISSFPLNQQYNVVLFGPFVNAAAAIDYSDKVKPVTPDRILTWLSADKYSFGIISRTNLELLKTNQELSGYIQLLQKALPGKF